jgi:RimJ/RimL family protein N-acetyltransferase
LVKGLEEDESVFTFAILLRNRHQDSAADTSSDDAKKLEGMAITDDLNGREKEEEMVGTMAFCNANIGDRSSEISLVQIFAKYRRRGFAMDAGRLLLNYALAPVAEGGLGLVRVEWHASTTNLGSIAVAQRLGFEKFGVVRYERFLKDGKERGKVGNGRSEVPPGTGVGDLWRDLVMFVVYWDTWEGMGGGKFCPGRERE